MKIESADDLIPRDHRVRAVWAVVQRMDLSAFHAPIKARTGVCGRDATDPKLLVSLWLWATIRGVGAAREVARLCRESRPYEWLCGGVTVNYHLLSDFRVDHGDALDALFTRTIASLVKNGLVKVKRISQDGTRVRASAGAASFRRASTLTELLDEAKQHVQALRTLLDDPEKSAGWSAKKKAARTRAARERVERIERAIALLPELEKKQQKRAKKIAKKDRDQKLKEPRATTSDADARVMKMPNGGFNPALNVQLAVDTDSRAIVGVDVTSQGCDNGLAEPMRKQVEQRTGQTVEQHLVDGGYHENGQVERAAEEGVTLFIPPKPPRNQGGERASGYDPVAGESQTMTDWRARMGSVDGQKIYRQRAATAETVNADLKTKRGVDRLQVRGIPKAKCVVLWAALACNLLRFGMAMVT